MQNIKLNKKILLVDDDLDWLETLKIFLNGPGLQILTASDGAEGESLLLKDQFDLVILDTNMPRMNGIELLKIIRILYPTLPVILFFSGLRGRSITAREILKMGANVVLEKAKARTHLKPLVAAFLLIQEVKKNTESKIPLEIHEDTLISLRNTAMPPETIRG